jgi:hypothetical protein
MLQLTLIEASTPLTVNKAAGNWLIIRQHCCKDSIASEKQHSQVHGATGRAPKPAKKACCAVMRLVHWLTPPSDARGCRPPRMRMALLAWHVATVAAVAVHCLSLASLLAARYWYVPSTNSPVSGS